MIIQAIYMLSIIILKVSFYNIIYIILLIGMENKEKYNDNCKKQINNLNIKYSRFIEMLNESYNNEKNLILLENQLKDKNNNNEPYNTNNRNNINEHFVANVANVANVTNVTNNMNEHFVANVANVANITNNMNEHFVANTNNESSKINSDESPIPNSDKKSN